MTGSPWCKSAFTSLIALGAMAAGAPAADLSKYRGVELGTDLQTVARQLGASAREATIVHRRPALIQELEWRPQASGLSRKAESVQEVVFGFYNGELFRIAVRYDRYETEGLTANDFIEALSTTYGVAESPVPPTNAMPGGYGDLDEIVARWQDSQYCFDLIRSSYGPSFKLIGLLKRLQGPFEGAITEARRLDDQEAPQRDAARMAGEREAERTKLEDARVLNKPRFRP